jgi:hypothetical protein
MLLFINHVDQCTIDVTKIIVLKKQKSKKYDLSHGVKNEK